MGAGGMRTRRMLEGKEEMVGVAGRTFRDVWGERVEVLMEALLDDMEEALECVWTWWMLRMEDTDEEVERIPAEERRLDERGVRGAGESEERCEGVRVRGRGVGVLLCWYWRYCCLGVMSRSGVVPASLFVGDRLALTGLSS